MKNIIWKYQSLLFYLKTSDVERDSYRQSSLLIEKLSGMFAIIGRVPK